MMKESVLDVLIYLFENYADPDFHDEIESGSQKGDTRESLRSELSLAGFNPGAVDSALAWLDTLATGGQRQAIAPAGNALRVFSSSECGKLTTECRGYILFLEQLGILNVTQRELIIDRLLALQSATFEQPIELEQVKWVVLMVLFSQPGEEAAYARMEDLLFSGRAQALH